MEHQINLPEDDAHAVSHLIEFLYTGCYKARQKPPQENLILAELYILAEKYALDKLKDLALYELAGISDDSELFFTTIALKIYDNTPESDSLFRDFVKGVISTLVRREDPTYYEDIEAHLERFMAEGGVACTRDVIDACCSAYKVKYEDYEKRSTISEAEFERARDKIWFLVDKLTDVRMDELASSSLALANRMYDEMVAEHRGPHAAQKRTKINVLLNSARERRKLLSDLEHVRTRMRFWRHYEYGSFGLPPPPSSELLTSSTPSRGALSRALAPPRVYIP